MIDRDMRFSRLERAQNFGPVHGLTFSDLCLLTLPGVQTAVQNALFEGL